MGGLLRSNEAYALNVGTATARGILTSGGTATTGTTELIVYNAQNTTVTINSVIANNGAGNLTKLVKSGAGALTLTAANTYSGGTVVDQGTVTINATAGAGTVVIPTGGITLNNANLTMSTNQGQIDASNDVAVNGGSVLTLVGTNTLNSITFNSTGGAATPTVAVGTKLTLSSATAITVTNDNFSYTPTISGTELVLADGATISTSGLSPDSLIISAKISTVAATAPIVKTGAGSLVLSGANAFANGFNLSQGTVIFAASSTGTPPAVTAGPVGTGTLTLGNGVAIMSDGTARTIGNAVSVGGDFTFGNPDSMSARANAGNSLTLSGVVTLADGAHTITVNGLLMTGTISGQLTGGTNLTKNGAGTLVLSSAANDYGGSTTVNAGVLQLGVAGAIPNDSALTVASSAYFNLNGFAETVGSLAGAGVVTNSGAAATLTVGVDGTSTTFSGSITNQTNALSLTKTGVGDLILSGTNTYTGATSVTGGTLTVNGSLGAGSAVNVSGATLDGTGTVNGAVTLSGTAILASTGTLTLNSTLAVSGSDNQIGSGTVNVTGGTTVNSGVALVVNGTLGSAVALTSNASLSGTSGAVTGAVTMAGGNAVSGTLTLGSLSVSGTGNQIGSGTVNVTGGTTVNSSADLAVNGTLGSDVALTSNASLSGTSGAVTGAVTMAGGNTVSGTLDLGSLSVSGTGNQIGSGTVNVTGGTTVNSSADLAVNGTLGSDVALTSNASLSGTSGAVTGAVTMAGGNTVSGTLSLGSLSVSGTSNQIGSGTVNVTGGTTVNSSAALAVNGTLGSAVALHSNASLSGTSGAVTGAVTMAGGNAVSGTLDLGSLSVSGTGNQIGSGTVNVTGGTTVNSGAALAVHGTLSGTLNVSGTVSGTGNVGALSIQNGGKLAAGNGASGGTLTATSLTLYSGSTLDYYLGSTFTAVTSTDGLTINGGQFNLASGAGTFTSYHLISFAGSIQGPADLNTVLSVNPADKVAGRTYNFVQNGSWIDLVIDTTNHSQLVGDALTDVRVLKNSTSTPRPVTINNTGEATHYSLSNSSAGTDTVLLSSSAQFPIASNATDSSVSVGWANTGTVGARTGKIAITNVDNAADTPADTSVSGAVVDNRVLTAGVVTGLLHAGQNATTLLTTTGTDSEATRLALAGSATSVTDGGVTIASASSSSTAFNSADSSQTLNVTLAAGKYSGTNVNITSLVSLAETLAGATVLTTNVTINADVFSGNGTWSGGSGSWGTGASTNWADENGVQAAPGTFGVAYANTDTATFSGTGGTVTLDSAVSLKSITFTNSAYTIAAGGGSLALASNSGTATVTVSGGTASHAINAPVTVDSSSNLQVSVIGGATLTFGANVTVDSGKSLIVGDATHTGTTVLVGTNNTAGSTVINYGTLQVGDGTTASRLISSTITLYNSGELNLQANAAVTASGGLNLYDNSKVTGMGTVNGNVTLHNSSTFQSTSLILNGTLTAVSGSSGSTTAGTATTVTGNTTVEGTFTVVGSSTYTSEGTVDVSGSLANPALFNVGGTVTSVGGITVSSYGTLSIDSGANVGTTGTGGVTTNVVLSGGTVSNNGTINGNLNVNGTGGALSGSGVVSGTVNVTAGTFTVNADGGNPSSFTAQSIVVSGSGTQFNLNGQTATVQQSMSVGSGSSFTTGVGGHLIDNGSTITWDSNSLVTVNADASVVSKHVIINGTGNLVESAGSVGTSGGLIQIQATGDGLELSGATLTLQSDSSYNRAGKLILDSGAGSANASQTVAGGAGLWVHAGASTIKSSGTGTVAGSVNLGGGQTVFLDSNASLNLQNLNLTNGNLTVQAKDNTGKLLFSGSNTVEGAASILSGVLTLARDVSASSPVLSFGTTSNGLTIGENATLVVGENATGSGTVTVDGDLSVAGNMAFYVGGSGVADLLVVNDTLTLDNATISVNLTSDLTASTYYLVDYTTAGGTFTLNSVVDWGTTTYNHAGYQLGYDSHSIYIAVVPEPSTWAMLLTAGLMGGIGYWRRRRQNGRGNASNFR